MFCEDFNVESLVKLAMLFRSVKTSISIFACTHTHKEDSQRLGVLYALSSAPDRRYLMGPSVLHNETEDGLDRLGLIDFRWF